MRSSASATSRRSRLALCGLLAVAAAIILVAGRGLTFRGDEWSWLTSALHLTPGVVLHDYNGHLVAFAKILFWVLPSLVGLTHYWPYRVTALLPALVVAALVFTLARRRLSEPLAFALTAIVALLGTGSDVFLSQVDAGIGVAVAACLGTLVCLDRDRRGGDLWACLLLALGLVSFTVAATFTIGIVVELAWRRAWRRLWIPLVPGVLYLGWRLHWAHSVTGGQSGPSGGPLTVAHHALQIAAGAVFGLAGVQLDSPTLTHHLPWLDGVAQVVTGVLAAAVVATVAWVLVTHRSLIGARLANVLVTGLALFVTFAIGRGTVGDLYASRYVYQAAIAVVLIAIELPSLAPAGLPTRLRGRLPTPSRSALMRGLLAAAAVSLALNLVWMFVWARYQRRESNTVRAQLAALELAGPSIPPTFRPTTGFTLVALTTGHFRALRSKFGGSPAESLSQLRHASPTNRAAADGVLIRATMPQLVAGGGRARPSVACTRVTIARGSHAATVQLTVAGSATIVVDAPRGALVGVALRRFGDAYVTVAGYVSSGPRRLALPGGGAVTPWRLRVLSTRPTRICG